MSNTVLVVGSKSINLQKAIKECYAEQLTSESKVLIETKYYKATVEFLFLSLTHQKQEIKIPEDIQGIILVFDSKSSFVELQEFYVEYVNKEKLQNQISLKIVNPATLIDTPYLKSAKFWCIERQMELVEQDEEPNRVKEALKCTMWPVMNMDIPKNNKIIKEVEKEEKEEENEGEEEKEEINKINIKLPASWNDPPKNINPKGNKILEDIMNSLKVTQKPPEIKKVEVKEEEEEVKINLNIKKINNEQPPKNINPNIDDVLQSLMIKNNKEENPKEKEGEKDHEDFDNLLRKMVVLKQSGASLTDNERRKRAGNLAMKLFNLLGDDEEEEEEEEKEKENNDKNVEKKK